MDVQTHILSILVKFHFEKSICRMLNTRVPLFKKDKCTKAAIFDISKTTSYMCFAIALF